MSGGTSLTVSPPMAASVALSLRTSAVLGLSWPTTSLGLCSGRRGCPAFPVCTPKYARRSRDEGPALPKILHRASSLRGPVLPMIPHRASSSRRSQEIRSQLNYPIISPEDHWGVWAALFATGAFGLWSEKTKIGSMVSGSLMSTMVGLAASNLGLIPHAAHAYSIFMEFLLPLTVPLLLFRADLRRVLSSTGSFLLAFLLGTVATMLGTLVAFWLVPMRSLGQDNWKIAAALMASYIGGSVNYVAVSEALGIAPSVLAAGLAADNVICAIYFVVLFALAFQIPPEAPTSVTNVDLACSQTGSYNPVLKTASALAVSFMICKVATCSTQLFDIQGGILPGVTALAVIAATLLYKKFGELAPAADTVALILMQVFFAVIGASGSIWNVLNTAPSIFFFAIVQVSVHLSVILGVGKLLNMELKLLLLASNANIGGPTTACGMATAKGWNSLILSGVVAGIFGVSVATFLGIGFGTMFLRNM